MMSGRTILRRFGTCIAPDLATLQPDLRKRNVEVLLVSYGDAQSNRHLAEEHGLQCPILLHKPCTAHGSKGVECRRSCDAALAGWRCVDRCTAYAVSVERRCHRQRSERYTCSAQEREHRSHYPLPFLLAAPQGPRASRDALRLSRWLDRTMYRAERLGGSTP